ncbi:hypothetical protein BD413DRAFT_82006 [Trametes elegans]|nr:hypothetical protein BD413DRAFT_82006 [Trametes elegans]
MRMAMHLHCSRLSACLARALILCYCAPPSSAAANPPPSLSGQFQCTVWLPGTFLVFTCAISHPTFQNWFSALKTLQIGSASPLTTRICTVRNTAIDATFLHRPLCYCFVLSVPLRVHPPLCLDKRLSCPILCRTSRHMAVSSKSTCISAQWAGRSYHCLYHKPSKPNIISHIVPCTPPDRSCLDRSDHSLYTPLMVVQTCSRNAPMLLLCCLCTTALTRFARLGRMARCAHLSGTMDHFLLHPPLADLKAFGSILCISVH